MVSGIVAFFMVFHCLKFMERAHMREKMRLFGKYIRDHLHVKAVSFIDIFLSPFIMKQFLVLLDMFTGFTEGIEGHEQLFTFEPVSHKETQTDLSDTCNTEQTKLIEQKQN